MLRRIGQRVAGISWRGVVSPSAWPIVVRMSLDMLLAALIPLGLAVWLTSVQSRRDLEEAAREDLHTLAEVTAARLDQLVVDTSRMAQQVARDDSVLAICSGKVVTPSLRGAVERQLAAVVDTNPDYASIFVTDANGIGLAGTNPKNVGMDLNFREYCRRARAGEVYISDFLVGKTTGEPGVYFSAPVRAGSGPSPSGPVIGTVALKLKGEEIWKLVSEVKAGRHGYGFLTDANGVLIAHPCKEFLYRSFGPLSEAPLGRIDPQTTCQLPAIESLGIPDLMGPATDPARAGSFVYTVPAGHDPSGYTAWVGGYARMQERPWKVAVVEPQAELSEAIGLALRRHGLMALMVAVAAGLVALWRAGNMVRPLLAVTTAARQLASGDFSTRAEQYGTDEIGQLAAAFNAMVPQLKERVDLQQSLAVAMEVQRSLLPAADPDDPRLDIAGRARYCDATGGDYYDFIEIVRSSSKTTLIAVGDVSGHGISSALLMAFVRGALRAGAAEEDRLAALLGRVNRVLAVDARHGRFMTLLLLVVDSQAGVVRWAGAGHDPPLVYRAASDTFEVPDGGNIPLGVLPETAFDEYQYPGLLPGDVLVVGTDGIWETHNEAGELFGKERLQATMREHRAAPAARIADAIETTLAAFRAPLPQQDDVTFVVVKPK